MKQPFCRLVWPARLAAMVRSLLCHFFLALVFLADRAIAVTPWTLLVNTNNIIVATNATYGAAGDGVTVNTTAIQNAINAAAAGGTTNGLSGGTVRIPGPGIYLCGPLTLKSSVNLQVAAGAILRMLPYGIYPGAPYGRGNTVPSFISASKLHDICVSGPGAIDGQGAPWWPGYATNTRPIMLSWSGCNRELIQNITLSNSPEFHIAIGGSAGNSTVQEVTIFAPSSGDPTHPSHNTDACDVSGTNILVQNCNISTGDDDFTCGGGTHDVLLTNNVYGTGHGVSVGSYTDSGGVSNITVINCSFTGTDNGIRLKSERGRGGLVQNLNYLNLTMTNVGWPLLIYSYYEIGLGTLTSVDPVFAANIAVTNATTLNSTTPIWCNITFSNITATMPAGRPPLMVWALPEAPASNLVFDAVNITSSSTLEPGVYNATNVQFVDCSFNLPAGADTVQMWNANLIFANSEASTNLVLVDGLTTNGIGNSLQFYNALASLSNTNALAAGPLTLSASAFTVSNNLSLAPDTVLNFVLSTNPTTLAVTGNLTLGGTNNIYAGPGFGAGTYTLMTYAGRLSGSAPTLGIVPGGYNYLMDTSAPGAVKLMVYTNMPAPRPPANLTATPANALVKLNWSASLTATNYNVKRSLTSGNGYAAIASLVGTNYSDVNVTNGVTYYYVVTAVGAGGESINSLPASAAPLPSVSPINLGAQVAGGQVQLSWLPDHLGWRLQTQTTVLTN